jgi:hypothetical protein
MDHSQIFSYIYNYKLWGDDNSNLYSGSSGTGSSIKNIKDTWVPFLKYFIIEKDIKSVCDLGSGTFSQGHTIYDDLDITYKGYDVYDKLSPLYTGKYQFINMDIFKDKHLIEPADLCILKDILCHWSIIEIETFLDYLIYNKKFKYIIICNGYGITTNIKTGHWTTSNPNEYPLKKYNPEILYTYLEDEVAPKYVCLLKISA